MSLPRLNAFAFRSLGRALRHPLSLLNPKLDPKLREAIILRVSSLNNCMVCSAVHNHVAKLQGLNACEIQNARAKPDLADPQTAIALRYVELRTLDMEHDFPEDIEKFEAAFAIPEREAIAAWADLYSFFNRFNNTWEGLLPGAEKRRSNLGLHPRN